MLTIVEIMKNKLTFPAGLGKLTWFIVYLHTALSPLCRKRPELKVMFTLAALGKIFSRYVIPVVDRPTSGSGSQSIWDHLRVTQHSQSEEKGSF